MTHKLLSLRLISSWLAGWLALHSVSFGAMVDPEFTVATFKDQDRMRGSATDDWLTTDTELGQSVDMRSRLGDLSWVFVVGDTEQSNVVAKKKEHASNT